VRIKGPAVRLTIFVTRTDQYHWQSVACQILFRAHKAGLAGATTLHAIAGYSGLGPIRTVKTFSLTQHLPAIIVIVDTADKIRAFLPQLDDLLTGGGLATIDPVEIIRYVGRAPGPPTPHT
jgi:PII-like signaling protein